MELARVARSESLTEVAEVQVDHEGGEFAAKWKLETFKFLMALNVLKRDKVYQGTVTRKMKLKRRALNARQKLSRKANRR